MQPIPAVPGGGASAGPAVAPGRPAWIAGDRVAGLGGYLGRPGDGPPGRRGYQRLADLVLGATAHTAPSPTGRG